MTCHEYERDLGDYVERALTPARAAAVDAHLQGCERCRALVADFATLRSVASSLERRTPPDHVCTQLAARLEREREPQPLRRESPVPFVLGWRSLLAGACMVVLLLGGSWFAWREASTVQSTRPRVAAASTPSTPLPTTSELQATQALNTEILHLEGIVNAGAEMLPDETHAAYQVNGAVIEQAIGQSRAALTTAPSDDLAQQSLFEALRSKVALLQDMVTLINEMRKGNQDAAARIVSGMEP